MIDKQQLHLLGIVMMWVSRMLSIKDVALFGIFIVKYYYEGKLTFLLFGLGFLLMSIFFLVMGEKYKKKINILK